MQTQEINQELLVALRNLLNWGRTYTSPLDENTPHFLLIAATEALEHAEKVVIRAISH